MRARCCWMGGTSRTSPPRSATSGWCSRATRSFRISPFFRSDDRGAHGSRCGRGAAGWEGRHERPRREARHRDGVPELRALSASHRSSDRMIAGLTDPDAGAVLLDGRDVTNVPAEKRDIGMVFQSYALFPHLTVLQIG